MKLEAGIAIGIALIGAVAIGNWLDSRQGAPSKWHALVKTKGQAFPIPAHWLATNEGKVAHDLILPDAVPKPVAFDFDKADGPWFWHKSTRELAVAYFQHLCRTEAGEWIFEKPENVEGLYFARPEGGISERYLSDLYGPEAPWIEKEFQLMGEGPEWRGGQFVRPPFRKYRFVEEPRRDVRWQEKISSRYIRMDGYTSDFSIGRFGRIAGVRQLTPMNVTGIEKLESKYGLTWRGIFRKKDRELNIAGGELIIYEIKSKKVIAVSRTFQLTRQNGNGSFSAQWLTSPGCPNGIGIGEPLFMSDFAKRVLKEVNN